MRVWLSFICEYSRFISFPVLGETILARRERWELETVWCPRSCLRSAPNVWHLVSHCSTQQLPFYSSYAKCNNVYLCRLCGTGSLSANSSECKAFSIVVQFCTIVCCPWSKDSVLARTSTYVHMLLVMTSLVNGRTERRVSVPRYVMRRVCGRHMFLFHRKAVCSTIR